MGSRIDSSADSTVASAPEPLGAGAVAAPNHPTRVRLALIGLDRSGQFHAEALSLRPEFEVVAACEPNGTALRLPGVRASERPVYSRLEDLLGRADVDTVLIAGPIEERAEFARRALEAGKHVAIDPPPCTDAGQMRELCAAAGRAGRRLSVLPTRRCGTEFRVAFSIVQSEQLGPLNSARLLSWAKAVPEADPSSRRSAQQAADTLAIFTYQYVDQMLQLIRARPRSVFGRILPRATSGAASAAFTISVGFEPGVDALVDVNLESGAVLQTGWLLGGAHGGYSSGRIYLREASGEISDAPVSQSDLPPIDVYGELLAAERGQPELSSSASDAEAVIRVIDAARQSSQTGRIISLEPPVRAEGSLRRGAT